jgi:hypothetical protein
LGSKAPDGSRLERRHAPLVAHTFVEHVGELELDLEAATEAGIFAAGLAALAELFDPQSKGAPGSQEIELADFDHAAFELDDDRLRATVAGRYNQPRHLVKAATLNGLVLAQEGGRWHGRVVLDI